MRTEYKRYLLVWLALMSLLALTCGSAFLRLGAWNSAINLIIATVKALLVALFFMHLRGGRSLPRIVALTALVTLGLLFGLSGADYMTRTIHWGPWQAPRQIQPVMGG